MDISTLGNDDLMQQMFWNDRDIAALEAAQGEQVKAGHASITERMKAHRERANAIKGHPEFTVEGKRLRLVALIESSDIEVDKIADPLVAELEAKILSAQRSIDSVVKAEPTAADMMRAIEVRTICYGIDDTLATGTKVLMLAASGADDFSVEAILSAPAAFQLVDAATTTRARGIMAARLRPDQVGAVETNRAVLASLLNGVESAKRSFGSPAERNELGMADELQRRALALGKSMSVPASQAPGA